ncbi:MAG: bifunctional [glutamate--ammonia ligase]-adenylyl-L-tyrosine phosphorylase/[glutamate--ammonia-ligase] adenylyltransferase [Cardiobacteriaceae bacterium]|nr:bifunctional [glutamate--ammonia ligase]-adenylyl-L-tyrosine phosphorylase/[glutamate--ammonia-ligase] adenylyltransferase [Cardiobacteriaceae bacterium]
METLATRLQHWQDNPPEPSAIALRPDVLRLIQTSNYAAEQLRRQPALLTTLNDDDLNTNLATRLQQKLTNIDNEDSFMRVLRQFKHHWQVRFIHAIVNTRITQETFLARTSILAETLIDAALNWLHTRLVMRYGQPLDAQGKPLQMVVLGMGKLGGSELNFSSDIDLIFAYRENGTTHPAEEQKSIEHEIFFRKLAQKLIYTLDSTTADGIVYRVDMRLRPFGQTGPLALSFNAMENYYLIHGRDWERYAMMKARPVAGDKADGAALLATLKPYIYRRYLDYNALHAISDMKSSINRQIHEDGMEKHIKLGEGGIREAEFTVQAMQMIYGGQYPALQTTSFLNALKQIGTLAIWREAETATLHNAYLTLRGIENAIQFDHEQQSHLLPDKEEDWQRLALACAYPTTEALHQALTQARQHIHHRFNSIFIQEENTDDNLNEQQLEIDWSDPDTSSIDHWLKQQALDSLQISHISTALQKFARETNWQRLPQQTVQRLQRLLPALLQHCVQKPERWRGLDSILELIVAVSGRGVYINMLSEQPKLSAHLLDIAAHSAWLIQYIAAHPLVIDDITSERHITVGKSALEKDLNARLQNIDDEETWQHALRDFKLVQVFKTAWADIHNELPLMQVSDQLSYIAEITLQTALERANHTLQQKHGIPRKADGSPAEIAIIGYGKLGGIELGYGSDLDIIYLYDDGGSQGMSDGDKPLENLQYFTRLSQRTSNLLSAASSNGNIYDIDTRLRPGGSSGLPVCSIQTYARYLEESAWTWEHQALTRSRAVAGSAALAEQFQHIRQHILTRTAKPDLRHDILNMRQKMRDNDKSNSAEAFHLKKGRGGLIDIEFIVQYLLLAYAANEPFIIRMSDNIRQLAALEATGILTSSQAMTLRDAYRKMRGEAHHRQLNGQDNLVIAEEWHDTRQQVQTIWENIFQENTTTTPAS